MPQWKGPSHSSKTAGVHRILSILYAVISALAIAALLFTHRAASPNFWAGTAILLALSGTHFVVGTAAEKGRSWARIPSILLALPLLAAIPVGTIAGIYILRNSIPSWLPSEA